MKLLVLILVGLSVFVSGLDAHPLDEFTVNHYTAIRITPTHVDLRFRLDIAEIAAFGELKLMDKDGDGVVSDAEREAYLSDRVKMLSDGQTLTLNGQPIALIVQHADVERRAGNRGIPTFFITIDYQMPLTNLGTGTNTLNYFDDGYPWQNGWKEIIATAGNGVKIVQSSVPAEDRSKQLTDYPKTPQADRPQVSKAHIEFVLDPNAIGTGTTTTAPTVAPGFAGRSDFLSRFLNDPKTSQWLLFLAIPIAMALGAGHALSPGHGKTVVAAYLVGSRAAPRHACLLGIVVTITHTLGVFALGLAILFAARSVNSEALYPWLGFASGALIFCLGSWQFVRRLSARYSNNPTLDHAHAMPDSLSLTSLVTLGISGGLVPCPSALVVMLSAIGLHRPATGLLLIVAFSFGLASVLIIIGMLAVYSRKLFQLRPIPNPALLLISPLVVTVIGGLIAYQSLPR